MITSQSLRSPVFEVHAQEWSGTFSPDVQQAAVAALEDGQAIFFPELPFRLVNGEDRFLSPNLVQGGKNISYNPANQKVGGTSAAGAEKDALAAVMGRFSDQALGLVTALCPNYKPTLKRGRTSLRPVEAAGRHSSWRKDDTRLHVDAFPTTPLNGKRILRLFSNVNPSGKPRCWRLGEPFADVAQRFAPGVQPPMPGATAFMQLFRITRGRRSLYDHYMLKLHDAMKANDDYQKTCPQHNFDFPAQTTWLVFSDAVPHAVTAGQHQFEQTFYLPPEGMVRPEKSPVRILEKLTGKQMV